MMRWDDDDDEGKLNKSKSLRWNEMEGIKKEILILLLSVKPFDVQLMWSRLVFKSRDSWCESSTRHQNFCNFLSLDNGECGGGLKLKSSNMLIYICNRIFRVLC